MTEQKALTPIQKIESSLTSEAFIRSLQNSALETVKTNIKKNISDLLFLVRKTPALLNCDVASIAGALKQALGLGLEIHSALGHVFILPYGKECQVQLGYRGMLVLIRRSGVVSSISVEVVHKGDDFKYELGLEEKLSHTPKNESDEVTHAYCIVRFKDGGHQFCVMTKKELDKIKKTSKTANSPSSPWNTFPEEMMKKTTIRRLFKYLPLSIEMQKAVGLDEEADAGLQKNSKYSDAIETESKSINETVFGTEEIDPIDQEFTDSLSKK